MQQNAFCDKPGSRQIGQPAICFGDLASSADAVVQAAGLGAVIFIGLPAIFCSIVTNHLSHGGNTHKWPFLENI